MRLLLIEDDNNIAEILAVFLKAKGYMTDVAADGEKGYQLACGQNYDLIILDYNLPKMNGREVIESLRAVKINTPVLMLSVRSGLDDKIELLNLGVDDYLTKPFNLTEILAHIKAILRRPPVWQETSLKINDLELIPEKFQATKNGHRVSLSPREFSLLEYLLRHRGLIMSRQDIMEHVWDENADPFSNTIEVHISNLRRKLETKKQKFIFTVSGRGYKVDQKE